MYATLSPMQINLLKIGRDLDAEHRSRIRSEIFAAAKATFGIPANHKLKVEIDNTASDVYGVLIRKKDGSRYPLPATAVPLTPTQVEPVAPPPPPPTRWFKIDIDSFVDGYMDSYDWEDGSVSLDDDVLATSTIDGYLVSMTSDALYIQLREDQLF